MPCSLDILMRNWAKFIYAEVAKKIAHKPSQIFAKIPSGNYKSGALRQL